MGLIRKKPGQKVNILPKFEMSSAKFWVSVSLLFLFLSAFSWVAGDFIAKAELFNNNNYLAQVGAQNNSNSSSDEAMEDPCKKAEQEGLSVICGTVKSARIENKDGYLTNNEPLENVTVAVYEAMPDSPTGKTNDGSLGHLFSSTVTNSEGQYRIKARMTGPRERNIYVAYLCNGRLAALKRTKSSNNISSFPVHVNCGDNLATPDIPPAELAYVNRSGDLLSCLTNPLKNVARSTGLVPTDWQNVNSPKEVAIYDTPSPTIEGRVVEENYDFRYMSSDSAADSLSLSGTVGTVVNGLLPESQGAFWENDCRAKGLENCSTSEMTQEELHTSYFLNFIPESEAAPAYRTKEIRFNFKQTNVDPISMYGYLKAVYGDVANAFLQTQSQDTDTTPQLISCDDLENSKNTIAENDSNLKNTKLTTSPGLGLSSPYSCEKKIELLDEDDLDVPACQPGGGEDPLTWQEILDEPELKERYYRCDQVAIKGGIVYSKYYSGIDDDSGSSNLRDQEFSFFSTAADDPFFTQTNTVIPGTQPQKSLEVSGVTGEENYLNVIDSPYKETEASGGGEESSQALFFQQAENEGDVVVWDIGAQNMPACSVSSIAGEASQTLYEYGPDELNFIANFFDALAQHTSSGIAGTGSFATQDALDRDATLSGPGNGVQDYIDSILRAAAEEEQIDVSTIGIPEGLELAFQQTARIFGGGPATKSFGDRQTVELSADNLEIEYPLNDQNFEEFFPAYGTEGYPGEHQAYPWRDLDEGETCNVYGGVSGPIDERIRTCKVTNCQITEENPLIHPITKEPIVDPETGEQEVEIINRDCTTAEREACLLGNPTGNTSTCDVEEAGPYDEALAFRTGFTAKIRDGDESGFNVNKPVGVDVLSAESAELSNAFISPYSEKVTERKLATLDVDYSGSESSLGKTGYDIAEPSGGVPEHMYTISASPTSGSPKDFNNINYHCNISFEGDGSVNASQVLIPDSSYSWDCPVSAEFEFGSCDYIDPASLSSTGTAAPLEQLIQNLQGNANWNDLITRGRGQAGWEVIRQCYGQIVKDSLESGNDPAFTLAIWIEETAASNYTAFGQTVRDFGILPGGCGGLAEEADFKSQLACFLQKQQDYQGFCAPQPLTVAEFLGVFHLGETASCDYSGDAQWVGQVQSAYQSTHRNRERLDLNKAVTGSTTDWSQ